MERRGAEESSWKTVAEQRRPSLSMPANHSLHYWEERALTISEKSESDGTSGNDGGEEGVASQADVAGDAGLRELGDRPLVVLIDEVQHPD